MGTDERAVQRQRAAAQQAKRGVPEEHRADHIDLTSVYTYIITYTCISDIVLKHFEPSCLCTALRRQSVFRRTNTSQRAHEWDLMVAPLRMLTTSTQVHLF